MTTDFSHLHALELSHEVERLSNSKTAHERTMRTVWVSQLKKEIAGEKKFLGLDEVTLSDDEILNELVNESGQFGMGA